MFDFFEFCNEMLCVADNRGYFTRVNQAWTSTLGWSAEELTSRPYFEFVHPDDLAATIRESQMLRSGTYETVAFENRYRCRDGSYRWLSWRVKFAPGTKELVAAARDVTTDKLQAEALREAKERFAVLATQAPVGIFQSDRNAQCAFVNQHWTELTGLTSEESLGHGWMRAIHHEDLPRVMAKWQNCIENQLEYRDEYRLVQSSGGVRYVIAVARATADADGNLVTYIGTLLDITERKEAEERFQAYMNNSPAIAWAKDEAGRIVYINRTCENRFGIRLADWQGKTDFDIWPPEVAQPLWDNDRKVFAGGNPITVIEKKSNGDDEQSYWMNIKFLFRDRSNRQFIGGIGIDITEIKQTTNDLKSKQDLLRNLIEVQEQEKQFLCREFHDGLIQYVFGAVMLLESCLNKPNAPENMAKISSAISTLRRGIEDGRRVISGIRPDVLDDMGLEAAMQDLVGQFENSGIHITSRCDPEIGRLPNTLQTAVYRVAQEALNNAKKYSGTDVIRIKLTKDNGNLHLEVRDFGNGFDVEEARKRGFGLLGMNERVRLLDGEFLIQSDPDEGTCISVRLPIPKSSEAS
ncbi:Oxygen sensor histidine kinase NreB [Anatilimnocola aggregata]|uniref:Oxygen sensor histidine kinase NreB n=1 Tax=Anatilimnocola aggregata TaxID=2528021 RepID=A0A517Y6P4_9BACT|nr:PAS domain S-box protein [Anatilimnocola aggregata]QDU25901.1 Oxygen sensor histidine kinase NreB [Anatilimnocola aggregata]